MIASAFVDFKGYYHACGHRMSSVSLVVRAHLPIATTFQFYSSTTDWEIL